jgi:hypothetical protein
MFRRLPAVVNLTLTSDTQSTEGSETFLNTRDLQDKVVSELRGENLLHDTRVLDGTQTSISNAFLDHGTTSKIHVGTLFFLVTWVWCGTGFQLLSGSQTDFPEDAAAADVSGRKFTDIRAADLKHFCNLRRVSTEACLTYVAI